MLKELNEIDVHIIIIEMAITLISSLVYKRIRVCRRKEDEKKYYYYYYLCLFEAHSCDFVSIHNKFLI